jgi:hypothetical protein
MEYLPGRSFWVGGWIPKVDRYRYGTVPEVKRSTVPYDIGTGMVPTKLLQHLNTIDTCLFRIADTLLKEGSLRGGVISHAAFIAIEDV